MIRIELVEQSNGAHVMCAIPSCCGVLDCRRVTPMVRWPDGMVEAICDGCL